jgi:hypothetical protein
MKKNIGQADKLIRVVSGALIIVAGAYFKSVLGVFGMIPIISAEIGICPVYYVIGLSTVKKKSL